MILASEGNGNVVRGGTHYHTMGYTVNGGRQWRSRDIGFPASVIASSLPSPERGYAVASMAYRYHVEISGWPWPLAVLVFQQQLTCCFQFFLLLRIHLGIGQVQVIQGVHHGRCHG